jgi:Carboxypeptidase regulatory-like domain
MRFAGAAAILAVNFGLFGQSASSEGTVVDQTTGKPLERVHVNLRGPDNYGAMSDSAGHFSIAPVSPGRYAIKADRSGYVQIADKVTLIVKSDQPISDLKVTMALASMLSGRVVDQYGDPVSDLAVRIIAPPPGKSSPSQTAGGFSDTDERGEFHILAGPGKYYLEAEPGRPGGNGPPEVRADGSIEVIYSPTYYGRP